MLDDIKAQLTEISRNKLRSVLTIGGIVIGGMSVVIISAVGEIGRQTITSKLENMGIDSVMITASSETQGLDENDLEAVQCSGAVENAVPLMSRLTEIRAAGKSFDCMAWGINEDADKVISFSVMHGRMINRGDTASASKVCVMEEQLAVDFYGRSNIIGKKVILPLNGQVEEFEVVGVVTSGVSMLQNLFGEYIPAFVYIPYTAICEDGISDSFDTIAVKLSEAVKDSNAAESLEAAISQSESRNSSDGISVQNLINQKEQLTSLLETVTLVLSVIAGISLVVSGLSIMTVMLTSVKEKTREIGIKKAIGASDKDVLFEFLLQSVLITLIGAGIGIILGTGAVFAACAVIGITFSISFETIAAITLVSMTIGLVSGVYPAFLASKLTPVEALSR